MCELKVFQKNNIDITKRYVHVDHTSLFNMTITDSNSK